MSELSNAKIHFNDQGTPVASDFDDVYFSNDGGMAETDYVFLQQNGLPTRWQQHAAAAFHIFETGFGTGANFLLTWLRFREHRASHPSATCQRLYFSSTEKFPLSLADLSRALSVHTESVHTGLQSLCQLLLQAYPLSVPGCHRLSFDNGSVMLDLWFGDVNTLLPQLQSPIDAVYLDGFAPSKNPDMWQDSLFSNLARLSKTGTSVATFTSAGIVKRGLQGAGFTVKKVKGFGRKREMLTAAFGETSVAEANADANAYGNAYGNREAAPSTFAATTANASIGDSPASVLIVGGGIASVCCALALTQRGINVTLLCEDHTVAQQASQNRQGALYPNLHAGLTDDSQLHTQAFLYARRFYQHWAEQGIDFAYNWCGLLHLASNEQLAQRQHKLISKGYWPDSLVQAVDAPTASALAGLPLPHAGIYFPLAGWLSPQQFCQQAVAYLQQQSGFTLRPQLPVTALTQLDNGHWQLATEQGALKASTLVLACGSKLGQFAQTAHLPLNAIRGQVSHVKQPQMAPLKTVLCHKGYITPQWQGEHCVGATFDRGAALDRGAARADVKPEDNTENLQLVAEQLQHPSWFANSEVTGAAAAFRATLPDHLPLAGELKPNLYLLGAMGARGILLSPLLAEYLTCQICAEPLPLSQQLSKKVSVRRFELTT